MDENSTKIASITESLDVIKEKIKNILALLPAETGKIGGKSRSDAKADAARFNGKKGGRPRKIKT